MSLCSTAGAALSIRQDENGKEILQKFLDHNYSVNFLRVSFVDYFANLISVAIMPKRAALKAAQTKFISSFLSPTHGALFMTGAVNRSVLEASVDELHFDWTSLKECKYSPGHATVMVIARNPQSGKPNNGFGLDPRWQLHHQLEEAQPYSFLIGHEIEFLIYNDSTSFEGAPVAGFHACSTNLRGYTHILDDIVLDLETVGIHVMKYHSEGGPHGSFEIVLEPLAPMAAADALVYSHELIRCTAEKHGMHATLSPGPFAEGLHIGSHINLSIHPPDMQESFLAGMLEHFPAACAILMPTHEAGTRKKRLGTWVSWGNENKFTAIRKRGPGFWEIRCADATANPYLAAAVLIAAGMHGVRNRTTLMMKPWDDLVGEASEQAKKELGLTKQIPDSLNEALDELERDLPIIDLMGEDLIKMYTLVKRNEAETFSKMTSQERRAKLRAKY